MLVRADVAQKARIQIASFVSELLRKHYSPKKSIDIATILSEGRWDHDVPILVKNRPSVLYVPVKRGATESVPAQPLGIFPQSR